MTAFRYSEQPTDGICCLTGGKAVFFSYIVEETLPKRQSFAPVSYYLHELRKSLRIPVDNDEVETEDHTD